MKKAKTKLCPVCGTGRIPDDDTMWTRRSASKNRKATYKRVKAFHERRKAKENNGIVRIRG